MDNPVLLIDVAQVTEKDTRRKFTVFYDHLSKITNFFMMKFFVILPLILVPLMNNVRTRL